MSDCELEILAKNFPECDFEEALRDIEDCRELSKSSDQHYNYFAISDVTDDAIEKALNVAILCKTDDLVSRQSLIEEFTRLKSGQSVRDEIYLAGVISVLRTHGLEDEDGSKK